MKNTAIKRLLITIIVKGSVVYFFGYTVLTAFSLFADSQ